MGLIEHATHELGRVDVLVNNAGIQLLRQCTNSRSNAEMQLLRST
jgi:NADP-dependent 3-hydroxy acid dehydrogenase YdfG